MESANSDNISVLFNFSFPGEPEELSNSILTFGQINPIIISSVSGRKTIISGHRRFFILKKNNISPVFFEIPSVTIETGLLMYLVENLSQRDLNPVERIRICKYITDNDIPVPPFIISKGRLGDLKRNSSLYEFIENLNEKDLLVITKKDMSTNLIERLKRMGVSVSQKILEIVEAKKLTHQQTRMFVEDLYFIFMKGMSLINIFSEIEKLTFEEIREYMRTIVNPVLRRMEDDFSSFVKDYKNIKIEPPQNFEGDWYEIRGRFRDEKDMVCILKEIEDLIERWKKNPILK